MSIPSEQITSGISINQLNGLQYSTHLNSRDEFAIYHYPSGNNDIRRYQTVKIPLSNIIDKIAITLDTNNNLKAVYNVSGTIPVTPITSIGLNTPFDANFILSVEKGGTGTSNGSVSRWKNSVPALVNLEKNSNNFTNLQLINSQDDFANIQPLQFGVSGILPITHGGTGATSIQSVKDSLEIPGIGYFYKGGDAVSVPSGQWTKIQTVPIEGNGLYLFSYGCSFSSNNNGVRRIFLTESNTVTDPGRQALQVNGHAYLQGSLVEKYSSPTTVHIFAYQNSGSVLNAAPYIRVGRVGYRAAD